MAKLKHNPGFGSGLVVGLLAIAAAGVGFLLWRKRGVFGQDDVRLPPQLPTQQKEAGGAIYGGIVKHEYSSHKYVRNKDGSAWWENQDTPTKGGTSVSKVRMLDVLGNDTETPIGNTLANVAARASLKLEPGLADVLNKLVAAIRKHQWINFAKTVTSLNSPVTQDNEFAAIVLVYCIDVANRHSAITGDDMRTKLSEPDIKAAWKQATSDDDGFVESLEALAKVGAFPADKLPDALLALTQVLKQIQDAKTLASLGNLTIGSSVKSSVKT